MTPFRTALSSLAALTVSGVTHNYDVDGVPAELSRAQLPALLVLPDVGRSAARRSQGFQTLAFSGGAKTVTYTVTHLLLVAPAAAGRGPRSHLPWVIELIDAYFTALSASVTLGGALLEPAQVQVEPGVFAHGGVDYDGCAFRHTWVVPV